MQIPMCGPYLVIEVEADRSSRQADGVTEIRVEWFPRKVMTVGGGEKI